jgi:hypothetical protein
MQAINYLFFKINNKMDAYMAEKDIIRYLEESTDNVLVVFGHSTNFVKRSQLRGAFKSPTHRFTGDDTKKYYQILNRPLVSEDDMKKLLNKNYSIYNVHVLVNVLRVFSDSDPVHIHHRSVYEIEPYTLEEYLNV